MRLLAWNIRQGGGSRLPRIADALQRHDADIAGCARPAELLDFGMIPVVSVSGGER
jgi:hypothetical protein